MARDSIGRREFLKSAALGALAIGSSRCGGPAAGRRVANDGGDPPDGKSVDAATTGPDAALERAGSDDAGMESGGSETSPSPPPNLLFILADQWRAQALGCAGDINASTPTLDRFARESVTFAHTVSCAPVCSPYRGTLMTGRYPTNTGVFVNDVNLAQDPHSLASIFRQAGYDTGYIGKWHLDGAGCRLAFTPSERRQGFDRWAAIECTHDYNNSAYYAGDNGRERLTWSGYDAVAQTREMQRWLAERDPARPFCYFLSWGPPHDPYDSAPAAFANRFAPADIQLRPNVPASWRDQVRRDLAGYYAHIAALDACVADLLATLDTLGVADNTIVVFTSDHGDMHGSQGQPRKQRPWDESILVPFFLRYPAKLGRTARTIPMRLNTPDIMPTLLGLAGRSVPDAAALQGRDLSPILRQERAPDDEPALVMCVWPLADWSHAMGGKEYRGLRTGRFTYTRDLAGPWLLYDNIADPYQMTNLVGLPEVAAEQARLDAQLAAKLAAIGDSFREGAWYLKQWGYAVDPNDGAVPTNYVC